MAPWVFLLSERGCTHFPLSVKIDLENSGSPMLKTPNTQYAFYSGEDRIVGSEERCDRSQANLSDNFFQKNDLCVIDTS